MAHRDSIAELSALTEALVLEHRAEEARYAAILEGQPVARRKAEGLTWAPVSIVRTAFTLGGRPTVEIQAESGEPGAFRSGSAVQLSSSDAKGEAVSHRGIVRSARGLEAEVVLDGDELPEQATHRSWVLDARFDERSFKEMARALSDVLNAGRDGKPSRLAALREVVLGYARPEPVEPDPFAHPDLNDSQNSAVAHSLSAAEVTTLHGPPGTGKSYQTRAMIDEAKAYGESAFLVLALLCCSYRNKSSLVRKKIYFWTNSYLSEIRKRGRSDCCRCMLLRRGVTDRRHAVAGCDVTLAAHVLAA